MDSLLQKTFDAKKIAMSESNANVGRFIQDILSKWEAAIAQIDKNKLQYTARGLQERRAKAAKSAQIELNALQGKVSNQAKIKEYETKIDDVSAMEPLQALISEGREREVRQAMLAVSGDPLQFDAQFGQSIRDGNPTICGAVANSPLPLSIDPKLEQLAVEQYRLNRNPTVARLLAEATESQDNLDDMFQFADQELGIVDDPIAELAGATVNE